MFKLTACVSVHDDTHLWCGSSSSSSLLAAAPTAVVLRYIYSVLRLRDFEDCLGEVGRWEVAISEEFEVVAVAFDSINHCHEPPQAAERRP